MKVMANHANCWLPTVNYGYAKNQVAPDNVKTQWQEANDNRRMQFKVGDCKDSKY